MWPIQKRYFILIWIHFIYLRNVTALLTQLWSSPFNLYRGHIFVNTGGCLCIFIQINLEVLSWSVIILLNFWSCFRSTHCPFSCREISGLWGDWSPHTSLICHWLLCENSHLPPSVWVQTINPSHSLWAIHSASHSLLLLEIPSPQAGALITCCVWKRRK